MALSPPYAHVKLNFQSAGVKPWLNDFWFSITGVFPGGWNVNNACIAFENHFKTNMLNVMHTEVSLIGTDLLVNNAGIVATASTYTSLPGVGSTTMTPAEVAAIVRMQAAAAGRTGRGRIYISGLDSSLLLGGRIDPASLSLFSTIATMCQTSVADQGITYHPAVYSRKDNILYNIQYCTAETPVGTQRRRRTRR